MRNVDIVDIGSIPGLEKTIQKAFLIDGYHWRKARKKPLLTDTQKAKRLRLAADH